MRILVTGSRHHTDASLVAAAFDRLSPGPHIVVHGLAKGADALCAQDADRRGWRSEGHPADWSQGRSAGPVRNQHMVDLGADVCFAFPLRGSRGTFDCAKRARAAGIPVWVFRADRRPRIAEGRR